MPRWTRSSWSLKGAWRGKWTRNGSPVLEQQDGTGVALTGLFTQHQHHCLPSFPVLYPEGMPSCSGTGSWTSPWPWRPSRVSSINSRSQCRPPFPSSSGPSHAVLCASWMNMLILAQGLCTSCHCRQCPSHLSSSVGA